MIKHVCERCGEVSNGHKIYLGRTIATDFLPWNGSWGFKKIGICYECWRDFYKWMENKEEGQANG